jgi:hypothetical protein
MGGQYRCLTLALVEPSCRMGQRLRLPTSSHSGCGRRFMGMDAAERSGTGLRDCPGELREGVQGFSASFDLGGRVR